MWWMLFFWMFMHGTPTKGSMDMPPIRVKTGVSCATC